MTATESAREAFGTLHDTWILNAINSDTSSKADSGPHMHLRYIGVIHKAYHPEHSLKHKRGEEMYDIKVKQKSKMSAS